MAQVAVTINGRTYPVACDDGQEERTRKLAAYVAAKVAEFTGKVGQVGDARLLLLACLTVADELAETSDTLRRLRRGAGTNGHDPAAENALAAGLDNLASRIEAIAARLESSHL